MAKFVGSISLGLLTGVSYTLSTLSIPSLLSLPSAQTAYNTFLRLQSQSLFHLRTLSAISATSFLAAYLISPRYAQHPYLLWTTLVVGLSAGSDLWFSRDARIILVKENRRRQQHQQRDGASQLESSEDDMGFEGIGATPQQHQQQQQPNGEEVKNAMERFQLAQTVRGLIGGLGFVMSVVGIWGDGY
ncbi:MAG: hypothetical protein M1823_003014 [Watsoniomyces obsoletus]|nr:MAG: hypothetical protein M1823_003014 [Watsoniomyces obsoletus]